MSESSSSEVNILHVYSIDYVTTEPHEVVKKGVEWLNKNYLPYNTVFTTQSLVLSKVRGKYNIIAIIIIVYRVSAKKKCSTNPFKWYCFCVT